MLYFLYEHITKTILCMPMPSIIANEKCYFYDCQCIKIAVAVVVVDFFLYSVHCETLKVKCIVEHIDRDGKMVKEKRNRMNIYMFISF